MKTDSENEPMASVKDENTGGWTRLYAIVVTVLIAQIILYTWITKAFE